MIHLKNIFKGMLAGFIVTLGIIITLSFTAPNNKYFEIVRNLEIFATLYKEVNEYYVDDINPSQLMNKGVEKMLGELDPYTVYISEDEIEDFRTQSTGQYAGIGASTITIDGKTYVSMVYEGFSAEKEGLLIGDEIIRVDGTLIKGLNQEELNKLVKGQVKTKVRLTVKRPGVPGLIDLRFEREKISIPNVPYSGMLDEYIGYIKFTEFTKNGYKNIKKALQELLREGAEGIILDLRNNPGGLLTEAVDISNLFIPAELDVVHTKGKVESSNMEYVTRYNPTAPDIPLVVLVNNRSASASEIVAGTLQDYDRAVLIGQKTFGKGLVQNTRDLPYNSIVKMTIAKYYIPSGRCIQALDYTHRNPDGSVGKIPDSLKTEFTTRNGRKVYDGGGITPEITIESDQMSKIAFQLESEGYLFMYASVYAVNHDLIPYPDKFNLTDDEFDDFIKWVEQQDFNFQNPLANNFDRLTEEAKELDNTKVDNYLQAIEQKLDLPIAQYLLKEKEEIKRRLEVNIASRYYLEPGMIEAGLGDDPYIKKATEVLLSEEQYTRLLTGPNL